MEVTSFFFLVVFLLHYAGFYLVSSDDKVICALGLDTPGYTYPQGDIILEEGSPLEILCILRPNKKGLNSSSLAFFDDDKPIGPQFVNIYNETTLRLFVENPPPREYKYYCKNKDENGKYMGVCLNFVFVGHKPSAVENFSCVSYNWERLNCSWVPKQNFVPTTYTLGYHLKRTTKNLFMCPSKYDKVNYCVWDASSSPVYRQPFDTYYFNMTATNKLGSYSESYTFNHFAVVIPHKPLNLTLVEATSSSLTIKWSRHLTLKHFPPGLIHKVMYQSKWDLSNYWQVVDTARLSNSSEVVVYNITGLKYAHTLYDIRVMMKSAISEKDFQWSEPASITLRTKATVPGQPPETDIGSFETLNIDKQHRDVYLYWQQIPRHMENGDNFEYVITQSEEFGGDAIVPRNITPTEITKTFAKLKSLSSNSYRFTIVSSNKEGYSRIASYITVPSIDQSPQEPVSFTKIAFDSGVYELSWNVAPNIDSYTLFWCDNKQDRPFDCKGHLNWTKVFVGDELKKCNKSDCRLLKKNITLTTDKVYQFALSANTKTTSSGMVWASCTVLPHQARSKLKSVWINRIGATFMEVSWKLDCFDRSRIIQGFRISYCPIRDPQNSSCKEPIKHITIEGDSNTSHGNITDLKPYTTYIVDIAVVAENGVGLKSDPLLNTTMEAAPDLPPENLIAVKVTNASISLSWKPPPFLNGVLRYYQIHWNNNVTRVEDKSDVVNATLTDLYSYENYTVAVSACTVACSTNSAALKIRTEIGSPGQIATPHVKYNNSDLHISWTRPVHPSGLIDMYEVRLKVTDGITVVSERFEKTQGLSVHIELPECLNTGPPQYYFVSVRAINIDKKNMSLYGPWSLDGEGNCYSRSSAPSLQMIILMLICGVLASIAICISLAYTTRWIWVRCKAMQNVGVKLPPQLELDPVLFMEKTGDLPVSTHCTTQKPLDVGVTPQPDEELLLERKDKEEMMIESSIEDCEDGNIDRESSGCGSGHDSVSSSITAGTHITDSGTEADERPPSPDSPVFPNSPRRSSDLRQRNISHSGGGGEGYSRLAPAPSGVPSGGYVTLPSGPRGYVSHAPFWTQNTSSKGYVSAGSIPSCNATMYSKVGLKPGSIKSKDGSFSSSSSSSNREQVSEVPSVL